MCPFVITMCNAFSNDGFKSKPGVYSLSAARIDSTTPVPDRTPTPQVIHHERALSSSSNGSQILATQPHPERPTRSVPWMKSSQEYQPQQAPTQEPEFTEKWFKEESRERSCSCRGPSFWSSFFSCTPCCMGPMGCCMGPVGCCICI